MGTRAIGIVLEPAGMEEGILPVGIVHGVVEIFLLKEFVELGHAVFGIDLVKLVGLMRDGPSFREGEGAKALAFIGDAIDHPAVLIDLLLAVGSVEVDDHDANVAAREKVFGAGRLMGASR
jgi:hypothetical protein